MATHVQVIDRDVALALKALQGALSDIRVKKLLLELGFFAKTGILERTAAGVDVDNSLFTPYSNAYRFFRFKAGRPVNKVDLFFKGHMMGSMSVKADASKATVYFADKEQSRKAEKHHYGMNKLPERKFFAINLEDIQGIEKIVDQHIAKAMI